MKQERIPIWGDTIPYNTGRPKWDSLKVDPNLPPEEAMAAVFDPAHHTATSTREFDTAVWHNAILRGRVSRNFDDVPYLEPHVVEGSRICVLLCAGGAYLDVSTEDESRPVAEELNRHGITAFTLQYRIYPYTAPTMFLDCRRAVCYLRAHADEWGYDPDMICLGGFSAGGNLAATTAALFGEMPKIPGYTPDEIDRVSARPNALMLAYAKVIFTDTADLLVPLLGSAYFEGDRAAAVKHYTIPPHLSKDAPPAFLVCSQNDRVVNPLNSFAYASRCAELGISYELHVFAEGGHGYGSARNRAYSPWAPPGDYRGTESWTDLFAIWLEKTFSPPGKRNYR
jgi:acetyl esterase/lipase